MNCKTEVKWSMSVESNIFPDTLGDTIPILVQITMTQFPP